VLRLSLKPGEQVNIGENIRVIYRRTDQDGIRILLDVPKELPITRKGLRSDISETEYYQDHWSGGKR